MRQRDYKKQTSKQTSKANRWTKKYNIRMSKGSGGRREGRREAKALIVPDYIILVRYGIFICMMDVGIYFGLL